MNKKRPQRRDFFNPPHQNTSQLPSSNIPKLVDSDCLSSLLEDKIPSKKHRARLPSLKLNSDPNPYLKPNFAPQFSQNNSEPQNVNLIPDIATSPTSQLPKSNSSSTQKSINRNLFNTFSQDTSFQDSLKPVRPSYSLQDIDYDSSSTTDSFSFESSADPDAAFMLDEEDEAKLLQIQSDNENNFKDLAKVMVNSIKKNKKIQNTPAKPNFDISLSKNCQLDNNIDIPKFKLNNIRSKENIPRSSRVSDNEPENFELPNNIAKNDSILEELDPISKNIPLHNLNQSSSANSLQYPEKSPLKKLAPFPEKTPDFSKHKFVEDGSLLGWVSNVKPRKNTNVDFSIPITKLNNNSSNQPCDLPKKLSTNPSEIPSKTPIPISLNGYPNNLSQRLNLVPTLDTPTISKNPANNLIPSNAKYTDPNLDIKLEKILNAINRINSDISTLTQMVADVQYALEYQNTSNVSSQPSALSQRTKKISPNNKPLNKSLAVNNSLKSSISVDNKSQFPNSASTSMAKDDNIRALNNLGVGFYGSYILNSFIKYPLIIFSVIFVLFFAEFIYNDGLYLIRQ
ncbi:hypothetical protein AYI69_g1726 [Smittium culicis]|uniref:Uncharacterized protein n=1 Tax=Smittium culicis TaxID=133412 RepID=A0A1R1YPG2_9FUNG|nr:hypothetical protein AYI69_g1726 [Smittium culicis]